MTRRSNPSARNGRGSAFYGPQLLTRQARQQISALSPVLNERDRSFWNVIMNFDNTIDDCMAPHLETSLERYNTATAIVARSNEEFTNAATMGQQDVLVCSDPWIDGSPPATTGDAVAAIPEMSQSESQEFEPEATISARFLSSPVANETSRAAAIKVDTSPVGPIALNHDLIMPVPNNHHNWIPDSDAGGSQHDGNLTNTAVDQADVSSSESFAIRLEADMHDSGYYSTDHESDDDDDESLHTDAPGSPNSLHRKTSRRKKGSKNLVKCPEGTEQGSRVRKSRRRNDKWVDHANELIAYLKENLRRDWEEISHRVGHSKQSVQMRYLRSMRDRNKPPTSKEVQQLRRVILADWNLRWKRISTAMGPRFTRDRCLRSAVGVTGLFQGLVFPTDEPIQVRDELGTTHVIPPDPAGLSVAAREHIAAYDVERERDVVKMYVAPLQFLGSRSSSGSSDLNNRQC